MYPMRPDDARPLLPSSVSKLSLGAAFVNSGNLIPLDEGYMGT